MNLQDRQKLTREIFDECLAIAESKGTDYSGNEDSLANFKRNAERLGLTKYQVWLVYFAKHIDSVMNSIKAHPEYPQTESEPMRERLKDIIVYSVLLIALMSEDK